MLVLGVSLRRLITTMHAMEEEANHTFCAIDIFVLKKSSCYLSFLLGRNILGPIDFHLDHYTIHDLIVALLFSPILLLLDANGRVTAATVRSISLTRRRVVHTLGWW
jgi:hypothetical protein